MTESKTFLKKERFIVQQIAQDEHLSQIGALTDGFISYFDSQTIS